MATCDPSGRCSTSSARMSRHAREVIRCTSSMAIRTGSGGRDIAASNRPTTVRCETVSAAIALKSSASSGTRRSIAAARSVRNTTGSLSVSSAVSQATGAGVFRRPLDEEARLAVAGRRDHRDDRSIPGRPELAQQPRPAQRPDMPARHGEPGLEERIEQAAGAVASCGASTLDRFDLDSGGGRGHASTGWRRGPATEPVGQGSILSEERDGGPIAPRR